MSMISAILLGQLIEAEKEEKGEEDSEEDSKGDNNDCM